MKNTMGIPVKIEKPRGIGVRHWQILLILLGTISAFITRIDISVGIIPMTSKASHIKTYDWNESTNGLILNSFFWGLVIGQLPAGLLTHKFGAKILLLLAILGSAVFTKLIPFAASLGWIFVCILRFSIGLCQAFLLPCSNVLLAKWSHPTERGLSSLALAGGSLGIALIIAISGVIVESIVGWPGIFYCSAGIGFIWSLGWIVWGSESPSNHSTISDQERLYLENGFGSKLDKPNMLIPPVKRIFTSVPFMALLIANGAYSFGYFILIWQTQSYMEESLNNNIQSNTFLFALPHLIMMGFVAITATLSDYLINHHFISRTNGRKLFNSIGQFIPMLCMIGLCFITRNSAHTAVILLMISIGTGGGVYSGCVINAMDLAPNFASLLIAITMFVGNILSLLGSMFVESVVTDPAIPSQWNIVFIVIAAFYFVGNLIFVIFGEAKIQQWNEQAISQSKEEEEDF